MTRRDVEHKIVMEYVTPRKQEEMKRIKRKVISSRNYIDPHANGTNGSNVFILECGHEVRKKYSEGFPKNIYCKDCENLRSGSISQYGDLRTVWDKETQMPKTTNIKDANQ